MCGISGIVSFSTNNKDQLLSLPTLLDTIKHRGPDDEGCVFFSEDKVLTTYGNDTPEKVKTLNTSYSPKASIGDLRNEYNVGLGHRRLSIIDLSEYGHQPMCDSSANFWIVYNGEIYNYQELKKELIDLGHQFITETDTEVLLNAYKEWGKDCLNKLNGMWSFVIYDRKQQELFGARDRFGVKPFYYINNENGFVFSSEIKALLQLPDFEKKINPTAVYDYLISGKLEVGHESFFKGIYELKPAHSFTVKLKEKQLKINQYYQLNYNKKWESFDQNTFNKISKETYHKIYQAVKTHLNADVKVGTCLSGGLDSSIVTCIINEILSSENTAELQELFTAVYPKDVVDEEYWANIVAKSTKTNWNKTTPKATDLQQQLEDLIYYQDIPFTSSSSFSQYKVMELIGKTAVKVTLDGQGADELFGGYAPHYVSSVFNSLKALSFNSFTNNINGVKSNFSDRDLLLKLPLKHLYSKWFQKSYEQRLIKSQPELQFINKNFRNDHKNRLGLKNDEFNGNLNNLLAYQFTQHTLKHLLRLADRNSMRFSIESRMPFVDDLELVEATFNISGTYKIRNGISKYLLRHSTKHILPEKIFNRHDKIGFATPEQNWFIELKPYFKEIIFSQKSDEFINWEGIQHNFEHIYVNAINTDTKRLWRLINFALWRKVYKV